VSRFHPFYRIKTGDTACSLAEAPGKPTDEKARGVSLTGQGPPDSPGM